MTRLLVLGILKMKPMSGYDIKQILTLKNADQWGGVLIGSIYHAIKKLEQEKNIEIESVELTGHRQKAIYKITEKGKKHLEELIIESLKIPSVQYPSTMYSALSFLDKIEPKQIKQALQQQLKELEDEYNSLKFGQNEKEKAMKEKFDPMMELIFENMFCIIKQQQDFLKKIIKLLD